VRAPAVAGLGGLLEPAAIEALGQGRGLVLDDVLGADVALAVREEVLQLDARQYLRHAGVGRGAEVRPTVRGDRIAWLDPADAPAALLPVLEMFVALRRTLVEVAFVGVDAMECQVAIYDAGSGYAAHRDAPRGSSSRRITAVYYANPWRDGDGGELELFDDESGDAHCTRGVAPIADRLVVFRADATLHAVREVARGPRVAISAFMRNTAADVRGS
jgi:SM-20-related protein